LICVVYKIGEYKFFWMGGKEGISGVDVMIAREWIESVVEVHRVSDRMMVLSVSIGKVVLHLVSIYAPQVGRPMEEKEEFYSGLDKILAGIEENEIVLVCGDLTGHVGLKAEEFEGVIMWRVDVVAVCRVKGLGNS
jgi:exonuclease III